MFDPHVGVMLSSCIVCGEVCQPVTEIWLEAETNLFVVFFLNTVASVLWRFSIPELRVFIYREEVPGEKTLLAPR